MPITFADYTPKTLEEAVDFIVLNMDSSEYNHLKEEGPVGLHHGFGMALRNAWGLWREESDLAKHFRTRFGLGHADDMSGMILEAVWCKVTGEHYIPESDTKKYEMFWRDQGIDPLTQKKV